MIKTLLTFVVAAVGFIVYMDNANAGRLVCWRDYNGNVICDIARKPQPVVPVNVPTPTFPG